MLESVLAVLFYYLAWKVKALLTQGDTATAVGVKAVIEVQKPIIDKLGDLVTGEASNARDAVKESVRSRPCSVRRHG